MRWAVMLLLLLPLAAAGPDVEADCTSKETSKLRPAGQIVCEEGMATGTILAGAGGGALVLGGAFTWAWLAWLRWLPLVGGFTRLRSDSLLEQPIRKRLHELIDAEPGIHHQALVDRLGIGKGQAAHHLAMLTRARIITTMRGKGYASYFVRGAVDAPVMAGISVVRSGTAVKALRAISERPGLGKRPLARDVGCSEGSLRHHVRRFTEAGLVMEEEGLMLSPLGAQVVALLPEEVAAPDRPPGPMSA